MFWYFVINGREDIRPKVDKLLDEQLPSLNIEYKRYYCSGVGDGTRAVRLYSDLHRKDEVCFVACGGSGTANEVASGIVGMDNKSMAILGFGDTNDVIKYYKGLDFQDLRKIVNGTPVNVDILKAGDSYSLNAINLGFDAMVVLGSIQMMERGKSAVKAYRIGVLKALLTQRWQHISIVADGQKIYNGIVMSSCICNGGVCGGQYICGPRAANDDGMAEVMAFRPMSILEFALVLKHYAKGSYLDNAFCRRRLRYCRARHIELRSKHLIYLCLDGEMDAASSYDVDVLPHAIRLVLPKPQTESHED